MGSDDAATDQRFNIIERWPELFENLDARGRRVVVQVLAVQWHAGWIPNRDDVADLMACQLGEIDNEEHLRRNAARAELQRGKPISRASPMTFQPNAS